jgi:hypothetical protein
MSDEKTVAVTEESPREHYAVIGVRWNEVFPELVIAYRDEESLRERIARSSIIGISFGFREAAAASIPNQQSADADSKNIRGNPAFLREDDRRRPQSLRQRMRHRVGLTETRRVARATLQHVFAVGILMFYSRNLLGSAIRACVGA